MTEQFRMTAAASVQDAERQMNELAQLGFDFVQMSASGERIYVVMEDTGGNAGTVELEALQAGIPSQGPTAERQFSESELASGRR